MRGHLKPRGRIVAIGACLAVITAVMLLVLPATARPTDNGLQADVVSATTAHGSLPACVGDIGEQCVVRHFIYVQNTNRLVAGSAFTRANASNALVVSSIEQHAFVDGVPYTAFDFTYTPPPYPSYAPYSGHWAVSATCPSTGPPCNDLSSPAVLPGENTVVFYAGWAHGADEPNGLYVFTYTIHGTLNGVPVELSASTQPLRMTD